MSTVFNDNWMENFSFLAKRDPEYGPNRETYAVYLREAHELIVSLQAQLAKRDEQLADLEARNSRIRNALGLAVVGNKLPFRSKPFVNQTDDMIRLTVDIPIRALRDLRAALEK